MGYRIINMIVPIAEEEYEIYSIAKRSEDDVLDESEIERRLNDYDRLKTIEVAVREMISAKHMHGNIRMCPVTSQVLDALRPERPHEIDELLDDE